MTSRPGQEDQRLTQSETRQENWQRWGTYLPERQWGTVREDYSAGGNAWNFTHDMARYRVYRWGRDGLPGWTDRQCRLCPLVQIRFRGASVCLYQQQCFRGRFVRAAVTLSIFSASHRLLNAL
jgi:hypothetical protein